MPKTALDLSTEDLKKYHSDRAISRRKSTEKVELSQRRRRAMLTARKAAAMLRSDFAAKEVFAFGSLARLGYFTPCSDIVAQGIPSLRFFEAIGVVTGISREFKLELVPQQP